MPQNPTRRSLLKGAALLSATGLPLAQAQQKTALPDSEAVENQLSIHLTDDAKQLLKAALQNNARTSSMRLRTVLPENSEPCFVFPITPHEAKK